MTLLVWAPRYKLGQTAWDHIAKHWAVSIYKGLSLMIIIVMPDVQIPKREERRLPRQCNSQKGKFIADSSQGSCHIQRSGMGSESPEPKLLHKFIGWA